MSKLTLKSKSHKFDGIEVAVENATGDDKNNTGVKKVEAEKVEEKSTEKTGPVFSIKGDDPVPAKGDDLVPAEAGDSGRPKEGCGDGSEAASSDPAVDGKDCGESLYRNERLSLQSILVAKGTPKEIAQGYFDRKDTASLGSAWSEQDRAAHKRCAESKTEVEDNETKKAKHGEKVEATTTLVGAPVDEAKGDKDKSISKVPAKDEVKDKEDVKDGVKDKEDAKDEVKDKEDAKDGKDVSKDDEVKDKKDGKDDEAKGKKDEVQDVKDGKPSSGKIPKSKVGGLYKP